MKRTLALILALMLLVSGAAFAEELTLKVSNPDLFPVTTEAGAELTVFAGQVASVEDYNTNLETIAMEKLTGVHIDWQLANHTELDSKFNLSIASGEYPDIYLKWFSTNDIMAYGIDEGIFIPLNDLLDEHTYWYKRRMEETPSIRESLTAPDGNIYSLFVSVDERDEKNASLYPDKLWYFKAWMEQYKEATGKDVPATLDEFCDYLRYVRDNDMNGNGDAADEIPLLGTFQYDDQGSDPMYAIMNCFQLLPFNFMVTDEQNNVICAATTDAFREGLIYLNNMHREGLFPEEVYSLDLNQYRAVVNVTKPEDMVVGVAAAPYWMRFVTQSIYTTAYDDFTFLPPLKKDADTPAQTVMREVPIVGNFGSITSACKDPVLAIKWLDAIADPELVTISNNGVEGVNWTRKSAEDELPIIIQENSDHPLTGSSSTQNTVWHGIGWILPNFGTNYMDSYYEEGTDAWKCYTIQMEANAAYLAAGASAFFPDKTWCADEELNTESSELKTVIDSAISTGFSEFILGRKDPNSDAEWQAYLDNLNALGLERYCEVTRLINFGE